MTSVRKAKKALKKAQDNLPQAPSVQEAFDILWSAILRDPAWRANKHCLFIDTNTEWTPYEGYQRGHLHGGKALSYNVYALSVMSSTQEKL